MATHDLKAFLYLCWNSTKGQGFTCSASSVLHRESACQILFHGVHLLLPNKAQKRLTASSLMLTTGCHCGVRRLRPFRLCVPHLLVGLPISQAPYMYLIFDYYTIICISTRLVCYTIRVIKTTFRAAI